ncbi:nitrate- and nitrite sensing domain-containing protein [bacterium]|nr:nitrate- and nitrite sensing domain-containing protein [bacterium]
MIRFTIKAKIVLLAIIPFIAVLYFSLGGIAEKVTLLKHVNESEVLTTLAVKMSAFIHETQKERGMTAGYIGSKGTSFAGAGGLPGQRKLTDSKLSDLKKYIDSIEITKFGNDLKDRLTQAMKKTDEYAGHRKKVSSLNISASEGITFYTDQNALLLELIRFIAISVPTVEIRTQLNAYSNFLKGIERAGIERAVMSNAFAMDQLGFDTFKVFNNLVVNQEVYFEVFNADANAEQREYFSKILSGTAVDEVQRLRDIAFDNAGKESLGNIDSTYWFSQMTDKINLMLDIELKLADDFGIAVKSHRAAASVSMIIFIILVVVLIIVLVIFSIYVIIKVTRPIIAIKSVVGKVAEGDLTASFGKDSKIQNDELGDLSLSFVDMTKNLKDVITSIIEGSTELNTSSSDLLEVSAGLASEAKASTEKAGTVAAAAEELILGLPSVAFSLVGKDPQENYDTAAAVARQIVERLKTTPLPHGTILNINVPDVGLEELKGFEITRLGKRHPAQPAVKALDPRGYPVYWIGASGLEEDAGPGTDFHAIKENKVSITPIQLDMTNYAAFDKIESWVSGLMHCKK